MAHTVWQEARRASRVDRSAVWRETPVTVTLGGVLIEGVVDLAYQLDGVVTVVDFKTDRGDVSVDRYRHQVALYAEAMARVTGHPARAILLQI
jgi:ATP-dependent helicase/nuclease subunit A